MNKKIIKKNYEDFIIAIDFLISDVIKEAEIMRINLTDEDLSSNLEKFVRFIEKYLNMNEEVLNNKNITRFGAFLGDWHIKISKGNWSMVSNQNHPDYGEPVITNWTKNPKAEYSPFGIIGGVLREKDINILKRSIKSALSYMIKVDDKVKNKILEVIN